MTTRLIYLTLAISTCLAGCGGAEEPESWEWPGEMPKASASQDELIAWAEQDLIGRCVAEAGFTYHPGDWRQLAKSVRADADTWKPAPDRTIAVAHGYGINEPSEPRPEDPMAAYARSLGADRRRELGKVLHGDQNDVLRVQLPSGQVGFTPKGGCVSQARNRLYGDLQRYEDFQMVLPNLNNLVSQRIQNDPERAVATWDWAVCVNRRGFQVDSHEAAEDQAAQNYQRNLPDARQREIALATADADCAAAVGLPQLDERLHNRHRAAVTEQYRATIAAYPAFLAATAGQARVLRNSYPNG